MSEIEIDQEELELFLEEMDELLQILEEDIIKLEKQPDNPSILQEIFRAAHTIKGSAAAMGFIKLSNLAHSMETVFDGVRSNNISISMELIDVFLKCLDTLMKIKDEISEDQVVKSDIEGHLVELTGLLNTAGGGKGSERIVRLEKKNGGGKNVVTVELSVSEDCQMPSVRAFQVLSFLSDIGDIVKSVPTVQEIEEEVKMFPILLELSTNETVKKIEEVLAMISDITVLKCEEGSVSEELYSDNEKVFEEEQETENVEIQDLELELPETEEETEEETEDVTLDEEDTSESDDNKLPARVVKNDAEKTKKKTPPNGQQKNRKAAARTVRVDLEKMDTIMDLVGELVINRTRLTQLSKHFEEFLKTDEDTSGLNETADNIEYISTQLQENVMKARLLPIENIFNKYPRMVRDYSNKTGKKIELTIEGEKTELDRSVLDEIGDPLMHIIRNSIDHGIEAPEDRLVANKAVEGKVCIKAGYVEDHVLITIEDDGAGIDPAKVLSKARKIKLFPPEKLSAMKEKDIVNLVFEPGFSTAEKVSEVSGRGVGMDVVRTNIEKLNGKVTIQSTPGTGTTIFIKLPLTLAIVKSLLVSIGRRIFAIPLVSVIHTQRITMEDLRAVKGRETMLFRESVLPLIRLEKVFGITRRENEKEPGKIFIVVISWGGKRFGIVVDSLIGDQDMVIRPLGEYIGAVPGISGAAILGDGRIALIVDIDGFLKMKHESLDIEHSMLNVK